jgi:hypothetical protein
MDDGLTKSLKQQWYPLLQTEEKFLDDEDDIDIFSVSSQNVNIDSVSRYWV